MKQIITLGHCPKHVDTYHFITRLELLQIQVDELEHKATVHQGKAFLRIRKEEKGCSYMLKPKRKPSLFVHN